MPRRPTASPPTPPRRSPSEPSRRLEGAKVEKLRKQSCGVSEMEEGEVAPDPEPKARPVAADHRKKDESSRVKEKGPERGEAKKVDSGVMGNSGTQGKGVTGARAADNAGTEERKSKDAVVVEAGQVTNTRDEKSAPEVAEKVGGDEVHVQDETANVFDQVGQSTSSSTPKEALQEEVQ